MGSNTLEQKLTKYFDGEKASVMQLQIKRGKTSLSEIRDAMLDIGVILEEDLEQGVYVTRVTGGRRKVYGPIIAAACSNDGVDVAGVVVRGKKEPVFDAMGVFEDALNGKPPKPERRNMWLKFFFFLVLITIPIAVFARYYFFPQLVIPAQAATVKYNAAVEEFNDVVPRYNKTAKSVDVSNLRGFVGNAQELTVQGTDYFSVCKTVIGGNRAGKIKTDTVTVKKMKKELEEEIPVLEEIKCPTEEWVRSKLEKVDIIDQIEAVSPDNDPNSMLGKEGGYISCTYFSTGLLGKEVVKGSTPVEKGVDGGGAVEVYQTLEDAQARCEYLSGYDGTILYSGSYALVGTMVIRTSCLLSDETQYALTGSIVQSMIQD